MSRLVPWVIALHAWSALAVPGDDAEVPWGLRGITSSLLTVDYDQLPKAVDRLESIVRRTRPGRRDVADHLAQLGQRKFEGLSAVTGVLSKYLERSPALAPDYLESLTVGLFERIDRIANLADLEESIEFYFAAAARDPRLAATAFKFELETRVHFGTYEAYAELRDLIEIRETVDADWPILEAVARDLERPPDLVGPRACEDVLGLGLGLRNSQYANVMSWLNLARRAATVMPSLSRHPLVRMTDALYAKFQARVENEAKRARAEVERAELRRERRSIVAEVARWQAGVIGPGREAAFKHWEFIGRPAGPRYWQHVYHRRLASDPAYDVSLDGRTEAARRAKLAERFPVDSPAYRHLTQFHGPAVSEVERGTRTLPTPRGLAPLVPELPPNLRFDLTHHYDEHVWERAEARRSNAKFFLRRPPEYVVERFARLVQRLQANGAPVARATIAEGELRDARDVLERVRRDLARESYETTVWSIAKRNQVIEALDRAAWRVLEGRANHPNNVLLQAEVGGTRFNLAICVREPCNGRLRAGGVASIYPVCGTGVFVIPRASKITRAIERLEEPAISANKEFRLGLPSAKPCPADESGSP